MHVYVCVFGERMLCMWLLFCEGANEKVEQMNEGVIDVVLLLLLLLVVCKRVGEMFE